MIAAHALKIASSVSGTPLTQLWVLMVDGIEWNMMTLNIIPPPAPPRPWIFFLRSPYFPSPVLCPLSLVPCPPRRLAFGLTFLHLSSPTWQGVGVRYAYAVTISVKRALPPQIGPGGRLLGLVRRRNTSLGEFSTNELHVAFTVLSEGIDMHGSVSPRVSGIIPSVAGVNNVSGEGQKEDWGRVAYSDLEVERQSG